MTSNGQELKKAIRLLKEIYARCEKLPSGMSREIKKFLEEQIEDDK